MRTLAETCFDRGPGNWWPIFPILFWLTIIAVIAFFYRRGPWRRGGGSGRGRGESVLAERFANGEISEREYRDRLAVLKEKS